MIKYLLAAVLVSVLPSSALAQSDRGALSIIPKAGISIANLNPTDRIFMAGPNGFEQSVRSQYRSGFSAGVELEYQFADMQSVSVGAFYTNTGCKYANGETEDGENTFSVLHDNYLSMGYIQLPVMVSCYLVGGLAVKAGIQFGFLATSTWHHEIQSYTVDPDTNAKTYGTNYVSDGSASDMLNRMDISVPLGLSYEYEHMVFDARYNLGLRNIYKDMENYKNRFFTFTIGYRFDL